MPPFIFRVPPSLAPNTIFLLHSNELDGSVIFTDSSTTGNTHTITPSSANVVHSTAQSKFSGSSIRIPAGDFLTISPSNDFSFGTDDWTVDFQLYFTGNPFWTGLFWMNVPETLAILYNNSVSYGFCYQVGAGNDYNGSNLILTSNTWIHVAVVRSGGTITQYIDGVSTGNTYSIGTAPLDVPTEITIAKGGSGWSTNFDGYVDEVRVVAGVAAWTSNFTPPTAPY